MKRLAKREDLFEAIKFLLSRNSLCYYRILLLMAEEPLFNHDLQN